MSASQQDGAYPRPQLCRPGWRSLDGVWAFAYDDADAGHREGWFRPAAADRFDRVIVVPFPPESPASGIADRGPHPTVWYRRELSGDDLAVPADLSESRLLVHFGAVDYRADVWVDGQHVAHHVGGQAPFDVDITDALESFEDDAAKTHVLVVRAQDDPHDVSQPRGKQTWLSAPDKVWYERTTGIWQSVWLEHVPGAWIADLWWQADPDTGISATIEVAGLPPADPLISLALSLAGRPLGQVTAALHGRRLTVRVPVAALDNGVDREDLIWSPERPVLLDATVSLHGAGPGAPLDEVTSYLGVRSAGVGGSRFLLNGRPYFLRGVLNQGYRAATLLANQGTHELRREVELAKAMGFNTMRLHQKAEDPRLLFWADRLGLLLWAETGAAYEFTSTAIEQLTAEWVALVRRDRSHPSVVAWVPINESWGLPQLRTDPAQRSFAAGIADLTRALDPGRPVMSNEGWEHVDSDILGVHDYTSDPAELRERYGDAATVRRSLEHPGDAAAGRVVALTAAQLAKFDAGNAPFMVSEFGGLSLRPASDAFAYTEVSSDSDLAALLQDMFVALRSSPAVAGLCYTQLFDTAQETNGLLDERGEPKLPIETVRYIVTGEKDPR
ncbi:glycoside hydrolase family 2 TIM barrel-domain containing protein [Acidothermaceae bacterium B102]|nr:glycoside hydrolase family 2 TIM barrel-domain containing protein [Acidothermaceae bacterium B102]